MGKSGRSYRQRGKRNYECSGSMRPFSEKPGLMSPDYEPENFDDVMDIYAETDRSYMDVDHYQWDDEDDI